MKPAKIKALEDIWLVLMSSAATPEKKRETLWTGKLVQECSNLIGVEGGQGVKNEGVKEGLHAA